MSELSLHPFQRLNRHGEPLHSSSFAQAGKILVGKGAGSSASRSVAEHDPFQDRELISGGLVLMCDCTYVYLEHSGNLNFQHSTFSSHKKKRNLFKFLVWVYPNGTVALISGPYGK